MIAAIACPNRMMLVIGLIACLDQMVSMIHVTAHPNQVLLVDCTDLVLTLSHTLLCAVVLYANMYLGCGKS